MENFDRTFNKIVRAGDILVSGFNFGCGSSREQAATAILAKKIPLVVAGRSVKSSSIFLSVIFSSTYIHYYIFTKPHLANESYDLRCQC